MKKDIEFDKPRITSTIIIGIFMVVTIILIGTLYPVSWKALTDAVNGESGAVFIAFFGALAIVLVMGLIIVSAVVQIILLLFSIANKKSTIKGIRITSFVFDGLLSASIIAAVVKIILLACGI